MQPYADLSLFDQKLFLQRILIISFIVDIVLGFILSKKKSDRLNGYLLYNSEHDFIKTSLLKIQLCLFLCLILYQYGSKVDTPLGLRSEFFILGYAIFIVYQFGYFLYIRTELETNITNTSSIRYRLLSICIDPFGKNDDVILGDLPRYNISWNWKCFLFLEFWFLWNEVYGLGMFLLMFNFTLYLIIPGSTNYIFGVWLLVRGICPFFADYVKKVQLKHRYVP
jgi:hypothetical protein